MNKVVIIGAGQRARELRFLLKEEQNIDTDYFVVDKEFITADKVDSTQVISTMDLLSDFVSEETGIYLGIGMPHMNKARERFYQLIHQGGFRFESFISQYATVYAKEIGEGTTVFAGVNIGYGAQIGKCNHFEMGVTVSHDCQIGDFNFFCTRMHIVRQYQNRQRQFYWSKQHTP